jgi:hypothetical protein
MTHDWRVPEAGVASGMAPRSHVSTAHGAGGGSGSQLPACRCGDNLCGVCSAHHHEPAQFADVSGCKVHMFLGARRTCLWVQPGLAA